MLKLHNLEKHAVTPTRQLGETWRDCFHRECIDDAPDWIKESIIVRDSLLKRHSNVSSNPFLKKLQKELQEL